jgi:hypothetical protein
MGVGLAVALLLVIVATLRIDAHYRLPSSNSGFMLNACG